MDQKLLMAVGARAPGEILPSNLAVPAEFLHAEFGRVKGSANPAFEVLKMIAQGEDKLSAARLWNRGPVFELKYRDQADALIRKTRPVQKDCYACMEYNYDWFANDLDEPYTTPADKPFSWQGRLRVTGGRTSDSR